MDDMMIYVLVGVLAVILVGGVAMFAFGDLDSVSAKRRLKVDAAGGGESFGKRRSREDSVHANATKRLNELHQNATKVTFRLRLEQAGLKSTPAQFMLTFQLVGAVFGVAGYYFSGQALVGVGVAMVVAFYGPRWFLNRAIERRMMKFNQHFPNAIDIMVRGVKSGLPVTEGLRVIANEIPEPVKSEFRLVVDSGQVGVSLEDALARMSERMPSQDVNFFRTVLSIQKQTGGNLAEALQNLSDTLRERYKLKLKVKALTAEARVSAIILGCLPLVVGGAVYLLRPDYITLLWTHETGEMMLYGAGIWMTLGVLTLRAMVNFKT